MKASTFATAAAAAAAALTLMTRPASAQGEIPLPVITVSASGTVKITPDRAIIMIGVETEGKTAGEASQTNAQKQSAVLKSIRALGVDPRKITTLNYSVSAVERWNDALKRSEVIGYRVSNIVQVEASKVDLVGPIIDAGLSAGANRVTGLSFGTSEMTKYRDSALSIAVESARRQAEVAAKAAGGVITDLLGLDIVETRGIEPRPVPMAMRVAAAEAAPTPISEGELEVVATVRTHWRFEKR